MAEVVAPPEKRRSSELVVGLLLVVGGALGGLYVLWGGREVRVVVGSANELVRGTVLSRSDLVALEVPKTSIVIGVDASDAGSLLGKRLLVDLPKGVLLEPHVVTGDVPLAADEALIPLPLANSAVPSGLVRGDLVRLVISSNHDDPDSPLAEMLNETMEVFAVTKPDEFSDTVTVTVRGSVDASVDLVRASRIHVLKVGS